MSPELRSAVRQALGPMTSDSKCDEVVRAVLGVSQDHAHTPTDALEGCAEFLHNLAAAYHGDAIGTIGEEGRQMIRNALNCERWARALEALAERG